MNRTVFILSALLAALISPTTARAQLQNPATSPVINADRTVTFRLTAPKADSVS